MTAPARPTIAVSVVVASFSGERLLADCLASITPQSQSRGDIEVIVPTTLDLIGLAKLRAQFPRVRFLERPPSANVFELRAAGAAIAEGRFVLLAEDHVRVGADWIALLAAALEAGHDVAGGPVENGLTSGYGWGLYFCEYGVHMPPQNPGPAPVLSGLNIGYRREALETTSDLWIRELHENELNDRLRDLGRGPLWMVPEAVIDIRLGMTARQAMEHLATGGRQYGQYRARRSSASQRLALCLASPLVPAVLFARICRHVLQRQPARILRVVQSLPWIALLLGAWCYGEASGYLSAKRTVVGAAVPTGGGARENLR